MTSRAGPFSRDEVPIDGVDQALRFGADVRWAIVRIPDDELERPITNGSTRGIEAVLTPLAA
jgi:hypothetical protein